MVKFLISILIFLFAQHLASQQKYDTRPLSDEIKTVQLIVNDDKFLPPVIVLNSSDKITLSFDKLNIEDVRLRYRLIHCKADRTSSELNEVDFLNGFNDQPINNYRFSENTTVNYIHYSVSFPNEQMQMRLSGNYAVEVYDENNPDNILLQGCFSVVEPLARITGNVTGNTDIDINGAHQQLQFEVLHDMLPIQNAAREIIVVIRQNNRTDNEQINVQATYINPGKLVFEHRPELIFEAGNEYRRFETVNKNTEGLNVRKMFYEKPYIHALLITDESRAEKIRQYYKDQNGRFFIRNSNAADSDTGADYFMVTFTFNDSETNDSIFLNGDFICANLPRNTAQSSGEKNTFSVLLKQGSYNYQYVTNGKKGFTTKFTEGNYFNTENEYSVIVYYRAPASRYDQLVGWTTLKN